MFSKIAKNSTVVVYIQTVVRFHKIYSDFYKTELSCCIKIHTIMFSATSTLRVTFCNETRKNGLLYSEWGDSEATYCSLYVNCWVQMDHSLWVLEVKKGLEEPSSFQNIKILCRSLIFAVEKLLHFSDIAFPFPVSSAAISDLFSCVPFPFQCLQH